VALAAQTDGSAEKMRPEKNGKAVFLDRDGTINVEVGYLSRPDQVELIPGSAEALVLLRDAGFKLVVVSNQSGAARGYFTSSDVDRVNARLVEMLAERGAGLDALYYCPHIKEDGCACRKPLLGMIERARAEFGVDPKRSYVVGDKAVDVKLAKNAGAVSVIGAYRIRRGKRGRRSQAPTRPITRRPTPRGGEADRRVGESPVNRALQAAILALAILGAAACPKKSEKAAPAGPAAKASAVYMKTLSNCPEDMAWIPPAKVCLDLYEYPNVSGEVPLQGVAYEQAATFCEAMGKRLPTEEEW